MNWPVSRPRQARTQRPQSAPASTACDRHRHPCWISSRHYCPGVASPRYGSLSPVTDALCGLLFDQPFTGPQSLELGACPHIEPVRGKDEVAIAVASLTRMLDLAGRMRSPHLISCGGYCARCLILATTPPTHPPQQQGVDIDQYIELVNHPSLSPRSSTSKPGRATLKTGLGCLHNRGVPPRVTRCDSTGSSPEV